MRKISYLIAGVLIGGILLNGSVINAAPGLIAERSNQSIFVDGQKVELEAYNIAGANYVKLREVGKAVGFNVTWDGSAVQIDSTEPYQDDVIPQASATVTIPTDGSKYVPQVGDRILCDDGTVYEVKDVSRWENNVFMDGPMPDMPTPTCDWNLFPTLTLPKVEVKHYSSETGDNLFVTNLYELRRMQYTIYNALGKEPDAWRGNQLLAKINLTIPPEYEPYAGTFWPWRESQLTDLVHAIPNVRYYIAAYDYYHNGVFQHTRYYAMSI